MSAAVTDTPAVLDNTVPEATPKTRATRKAADVQPNIFQLISEVSREAGALAPEAKGGVPFAFRGVDQVVAHLAPHIKAKGIVVAPEVVDKNTTVREIGAKAITQTDLLTRFTFYAPDGSSFSVTTAGLAQDYADRSASQAQSVAFRVALLQTFMLPTTDKEPEERGEEVQAYITKAQGEAKAAAPVEAAPKMTPALARKLISTEFIDNPDTPHTQASVSALGDRITGKSTGDWMSDVGEIKKVYDALKAGETA